MVLYDKLQEGGFMANEFGLQGALDVGKNAIPISLEAKNARGVAKKYSNPKLNSMEEGAFERAMAEKHEKHQ